jgi:hypothetical protein
MALAVNIHAVAVGQLDNRPVMWHDGSHTFLGESEGGFATGINARNEISGTVFMNDTNIACVWRDGALTTLGVPGVFSSVAHSINDHGTVAGVRTWGQYISEGFVYRNNRLSDIGTMGFDGSALGKTNNLHQMIGIVWNLDLPKSYPIDIRGMVYADGHLVLLEVLAPPKSGWTDLNPSDINDHSQIVGVGNYNGALRGFVMSIPAGDVDGDTIANIDDLLAVIHAWGDCPATDQACPADLAPLGGDGVVNIDDLLQVINNWD